MNLLQRKLLMGGLLAAFAVQTTLVYTDETADSFGALSADAVRGRRIWHRHNCQTCHQIHGFGGFLGPDLTNAGKRLTDERLHEILTAGNAQMPAFGFDDEQIYYLTTFLDEMAEMGLGVPRSRAPLDPFAVRTAIDARLAASPPSQRVRQGADLFKLHCTACHVPLQSTPLGLQTAPDLSTAVERLDDKELTATITAGRVARGMPSWQHLSPGGIGDLVAFLHWLHDERGALLGAVGGGEQQPLPWWEYR